MFPDFSNLQRPMIFLRIHCRTAGCSVSLATTIAGNADTRRRVEIIFIFVVGFVRAMPWRSVAVGYSGVMCDRQNDFSHVPLQTQKSTTLVGELDNIEQTETQRTSVVIGLVSHHVHVEREKSF